MLNPELLEFSFVVRNFQIIIAWDMSFCHTSGGALLTLESQFFYNKLCKVIFYDLPPDFSNIL